MGWLSDFLLFKWLSDLFNGSRSGSHHDYGGYHDFDDCDDDCCHDDFDDFNDFDEL